MNLTFDVAYNRYIEYVSFRLKPTTILQIKRKFKNHILPIFKNKNINLLNDDDYKNWENYVRNLGLSNSFNNQVYSIIASYFNYLSQFYNIENFPKKYGKIINFKFEEKKERKIWKLKTFKKFIKKVKDKVYHALFNFLFWTGVRKGEALALKFKDYSKHYITINKSITKEFFNGERLILKPKTTSSIRKIKIDRKLSKEIEKLKKYYTEKYGYFSEDFYIFGGKKPIAPTTLERKKNEYCKLAKVIPIRIHDFRHSHATMLYNKKVKLKYIQQRLGHADISTTLNTYVHIDDGYEKRVVRTLNFLRLK